MRIVISLIFICFNLVAIAQINTNNINLYINNIKLTKDTISITLKIENRENKKISIIRFDREDICIHLLNFQIINISDSTKNRIYPCNDVTDLDNVICNDSNCIKIDPYSSFVFELKYGLD